MAGEVWMKRMDGEGPHRTLHKSHSSNQMAFPQSPSTSPSSSSTSPVQFGGSSERSHSKWGSSSSNSDTFFGTRIRKGSTQSRTTKGKQPLYNDDSPSRSGPNSISSSMKSTEMFLSLRRNSSPAIDVRPSTADSTFARKPRTSLLIAATDAIAVKFGRKKYPIRQAPMPIILPDVIEISAPRRDQDVEERNRLRDMAAQSIGIPSTMHPDTRSLDNSLEEDEDEDEEGTQRNATSPTPDLENRHFTNIRRDQPLGLASKSLQGSSVSIPNSSPGLPTRLRSGSVAAHSRSNSITLAPVPPFPTTLAALVQFKQLETTLFKFYPPSSLRIFALHKNWRGRHMVLSSPTALMRRSSSPPVSYLHLFKTSDGDEREVERLEINEDSVVFVAEEDVGGRRHVVKVAGADVGAQRKELNHEEGGRTMWFLHVIDPAEAQKWITAIKNAILGQRTMRAGLGLPSNTFGGIEPRGDMDVMLSMRAQGLLNTPAISGRLSQNSQVAYLQPDRTYASSISSHRSQATVSKSTASGTVSAIKGLLSSVRPRSPSRATSVDMKDETVPSEAESFSSMGNHLLSTGDGHLASHPTTPNSILPFDAATPPTEYRLDRKIIPDRASLFISSDSSLQSGQRSHRTLSLQTVSLQPPPRKRWTSLGPGDQEAASLANISINKAGTSGSDIASSEADLVSMSAFRFGLPASRARASSVSTFASGDYSPGTDKSSLNTKRSSKRWSRQAVLPRRLTPPSGPPPSAPNNHSNSSFSPTHLDRTPSEASSRHSTLSRQSVISSLPSFSKRASGSSFLSMTGPNNSSTASISRPASSHGHRTSMPPPPRPPPTSALPPAPDQDTPKPEQHIPPKLLLRESVVRGSRLSVLSARAPSPALSTVSDETAPRAIHRRSNSAGVHVPSSPVSQGSPPVSPLSPFPPPVGPLPPTPVTPRPDNPRPTSARRTSIKQRLRILSAPSSPPTPTAPYSPLTQQFALVNTSPASSTGTSASPITMSLPPTPIAEKIVHYDDDLSFLQMTTPVVPYSPPPRVLSTLPEPYPEVGLTPLSPPPRRGSKQVSIIEIETDTIEDKKPVVEEHKLVSPSRPGSVISLGIVSM